MSSNAAIATSPVGGGQARRRPRSDLKVALAFILPATIGLVTFFIVPTIRGFYLSFTEYSILGSPTWVGIENYQALVKDPLFHNAFWVTLQLGRPGARCRDCSRSVSPGRPPNRTCDFHRIRLSMREGWFSWW